MTPATNPAHIQPGQLTVLRSMLIQKRTLLKHSAPQSMESRAVNLALIRMDGNEYGQCYDCREPMPHHLLMSQPAALLCPACLELGKKDAGVLDRDPFGPHWGRMEHEPFG